MPTADAERPSRVTRLFDVLSGVGIAVVFTGMGALGLESLPYGAIAGLFGGVGAVLFVPWWRRLAVVQNAADDSVPFGDVIDRAGGVSGLGVFGMGLGVGGFAMIAVGLSLEEANFGLGLGAAVAVTAGVALAATVLFRELQRRGRRDRSDRESRSPQGSHTPRETTSERSRTNDEDERSGTDDESEPWTARLRPNTLGAAFGLLFAASVGSFFLSLIGFVGYALLLPEENPTLTLADPPVAAAVGSWLGILVSVFCYGCWSAWQLRTTRRAPAQPTDRNTVEKLNHVATVFTGDGEDLGPYDRRLRQTIWGFFGVLIWLLFTASMLFGSP